MAERTPEYAPWSSLRDEVMSDPKRAANVERIKEEVMAQQWPKPVTVGDPVLYHPGDGGLTVLGIVTAVAEHDGDCDIDYGVPDIKALDVKMGQGPHTFETLDVTPDWTIVHCPNDGHRWPSFMDACPHCGTELPDA